MYVCPGLKITGKKIPRNREISQHDLEPILTPVALFVFDILIHFFLSLKSSIFFHRADRPIRPRLALPVALTRLTWARRGCVCADCCIRETETAGPDHKGRKLCLRPTELTDISRPDYNGRQVWLPALTNTWQPKNSDLKLMHLGLH